MDKWKEDYIDGRKEGRQGGKMEGRLYRSKEGRKEECIEKAKKGKEGNLRMDGWVDGQMGGRMYEILEKGLMYERMERTG